MRLFDAIKYGIETAEKYSSGEFKPYLTGISLLDEYVPIIPGSTNLVAARPGQGKSHLVYSIFSNMIRKYKVALCAAEDTKENTCLRLLSHITGGAIRPAEVYKQRVHEDQWKVILDKVGKYFTPPVNDNGALAFTSGWPLDKVIKYFEALEARGCQVVIYDYLQLIKSAGQKEFFMAMAEISKEVTSYFKNSKMALIGVLQLNRAGDRTSATNPNSLPGLAELYGSSSWEMDSFSIIILQKLLKEARGQYTVTWEETDTFQIAIRKNRIGQVNKVFQVDKFYREIK